MFPKKKKSIHILSHLIFNNPYLFFGSFVETMKLKFSFACVDPRLVKAAALSFRLFMTSVRALFRSTDVRGLPSGRLRYLSKRML